MTGESIVDYKISQISQYMNKQQKLGVLQCKVSFPLILTGRYLMFIIYENSSLYIANFNFVKRGICEDNGIMLLRQVGKRSNTSAKH